MTRLLLFILCVFLLGSCARKQPPLPKAQLVNILVDVHIAEALLSGHHPVNLKETLEPKYLDQVLEKWKVTHSEFESALSHMNADPAYMTDILESTLKQVGEFSEELDEMDMEEVEERNKARPAKKPTQQGKGSISN